MTDLFLIQIIAFTCLGLLIQSHVDRGWKLMSILVLLILVGTVSQRMPYAVWIASAIWLFLIGIPLLGYGRVNRWVRQEKYERASKLAATLRWFHPMDGMFSYAKLLQALALGHQGKFQEAEALLRKYSTPKTSIGRMAIASLYRMGARWDELLAWLNQQPSQKPILQDVELAHFYLRSLGETGQLNELIDSADRFSRKYNRNADLARLYAFAFCGQPMQVQQLFEGALNKHSQITKTFWIATAEWLAGNDAQARQQFTALKQQSDRTLQQSIDWRLAQPRISVAQVLTPESKQTLERMGTAIAQDNQYNTRKAFQTRKAFATYTLMLANILVFIVTILPLLGVPFLLELLSSTQTALEPILTRAVTFAENLFEAWMLLPDKAASGEWWRIVSANFLHAGFLHLFANMLGLFVYGTLIETELGSRKFLFAYLFSGIGAMVTVTIVGLRFGDPTQGTVGASGAIMGLLGVFVAIQLKGWRTDKAAIALRQLRLGLILVAIQTISDLLTPQVSMIGHLSGFIFGFLVGFILKKKVA